MTKEQLNVLIDQSMKVAQAAHMGQKRNGGGDYFIEHVSQVAAAVEDYLKPIAFLHDVLEDTPVTLDQLKEAGFPDYVLNAVDILTHKNHEPNVSYWTRIAQNKDAATVKIADIKNNLSSSPSDRAKEKYAKALTLFQKFGYDVG